LTEKEEENITYIAYIIDLIYQNIKFIFTLHYTSCHFIKLFYKVVTEARFARRPTEGRLYTHPIQKINHIILYPEMSTIS
jgi:hypothetical protein